MLRLTMSRDVLVNSALDNIEGELRPALEAAVEQLNDLLQTKPGDTEPVHLQLKRLHGLIADIDGNRRRHCGV